MKQMILFIISFFASLLVSSLVGDNFDIKVDNGYFTKGKIHKSDSFHKIERTLKIKTE